MVENKNQKKINGGGSYHRKLKDHCWVGFGSLSLVDRESDPVSR